jgi:hypothetical protein
MITICHRINSIKLLKKIPYNYGVEIDIRDYKNTLILNHDPFKKGESFLKYLEHFKHKFLIINVKSEGIETKIYKILQKRKIKNFFFLDVSLPFIVKLSKSLTKKISIRVSDLESIQTASNFKKKVEWVWLDYFKDNELKLNNIKILKNMKYKVCYVSHDLQNRKIQNKEIAYFKKTKEKKVLLDMIIIKKENILKWKNVFK